jgi:hypothetical protein
MERRWFFMDEHCFIEIHFIFGNDEDPIKITVPLSSSGIDDLNFPSLLSPAIRMSAYGLNLHCSGGGVRYEVFLKIPLTRDILVTSGIM